MTRVEQWARFLSDRRLYGRASPPDEDRRSEFQRDYDRIIFSSAFRRLQDKTQVFPLSTHDYTRTRLTHTLEASSVARTLGTLAARHLNKQGVTCEPYDIGTIVATGTLAHDLGNPPFGHSGEEAIQSWARRRLRAPEADELQPEIKFGTRRRNAASIPMTAAEIADFHYFEGNAQGFRILVRTLVRTRRGGMRPTLATLGSMTKYPRPSFQPGKQFSSNIVSEKKPGYFQHDRAMALKAFGLLGLRQESPGTFSRHPLAFLTEAADDICYATADLEDAFKLGILTFNELRDALLPLAEQDNWYAEMDYLDEDSRLGRMRASALQVLVAACAKAFRDCLNDLEGGTLTSPLLHHTDCAEHHQALVNLAKQKVYRNERVLQIEYAGYQTIGGLLEMFYSALCEPNDLRKDKKLRALLPAQLLWRPDCAKRLATSGKDAHEFYLDLMTPYERLLAVTDYVSGMTDRFAVQLYQRLSGIRLPE
jgi:deoxyguanosinetriphosphate triphosphohydrolase, putative